MWFLVFVLLLAISFAVYVGQRFGPRVFVIYATCLLIVCWVVIGPGLDVLKGYQSKLFPDPPPTPQIRAVQPTTPQPAPAVAPPPQQAIAPAPAPQAPQRTEAKAKERSPSVASAPPTPPPPLPKSGSYKTNSNGLDYSIPLYGWIGFRSAEIVDDGAAVQFNFSIETSGNVELFLDAPEQTTYLTDQRGKRVPLLRGVNIGEGKPLPVPGQSERSFSLVYLIPPGAEKVQFSASVVSRWGTSEDRVRLTARPISLRLFH